MSEREDDMGRVLDLLGQIAYMLESLKESIEQRQQEPYCYACKVPMSNHWCGE